MSQLSESEEVPQWLQRASQVLARFMGEYSIRNFSRLQTEIKVPYNTLKKLDPKHIDPTISFESVLNIFAQLGYYILENEGKAIGEEDNYERYDTELMNITMLCFGKKKAA